MVAQDNIPDLAPLCSPRSAKINSSRFLRAQELYQTSTGQETSHTRHAFREVSWHHKCAPCHCGLLMTRLHLANWRVALAETERPASRVHSIGLGSTNLSYPPHSRKDVVVGKDEI